MIYMIYQLLSCEVFLQIDAFKHDNKSHKGFNMLQVFRLYNDTISFAVNFLASFSSNSVSN